MTEYPNITSRLVILSIHLYTFFFLSLRQGYNEWVGIKGNLAWGEGEDK